MIWENLKQAFQSLRGAKTRAFLTMLGIIIGVSSVSSIMAISEGIRSSVTNQVAEFGTNILQVSPGAGADGGEQASGGDIFASLGTSTLTEKDVETIEQVEGIEAAAPFMLVSGVIEAEGKKAKGTFLFATTPQIEKVIDFKLAQGSFFASGTAKAAVIGGDVAEQLFGSEPAVGKNVSIRRDAYRVVGVLEKPKQEGFLGGGPGMGTIVMIPLEAGKSYSGGAANIIEIDAKVASADQVKEVEQRVDDALLKNHGGQKDFSVLTPEDQLKLFDNILTALTGGVAAIAAISLLVGGVGIMNIMLVSVTERTREIGIRKALGATRSTILLQFLIESVVISLLGGAIGIAAAFGLGQIAESTVKISPVFTLQIFLIVAGISVGSGIIFGLMPAIKASRKRPIEALRYE